MSEFTAIKFEENKDKIKKAIGEKLKNSPVPGEAGFTLIEGFFNQPFQKELTGSFMIGGPTLPMVALVGNTTGRVYYFALKALLPDLKF